MRLDTPPRARKESRAYDAIIGEASRYGFPVIDLRALCNEAVDYSASEDVDILV
jgi:hypothetical protein